MEVDVFCDQSMLGGGVRWLRSSERFKFLTTSFSTNAKTTYYSFCTSSANKNNNKNMIVDERYRQLENLDMVTAAKILFSDPPKKRKFGYPFSFPLTMFTLSPLALFRISSSTFAALNMSTSLPLFGSVFYYHIWSFKLHVDTPKNLFFFSQIKKCLQLSFCIWVSC